METKINLHARANDAALIIRPARMLLSVITSPKGCQSGWGDYLGPTPVLFTERKQELPWSYLPCEKKIYLTKPEKKEIPIMISAQFSQTKRLINENV